MARAGFGGQADVGEIPAEPMGSLAGHSLSVLVHEVSSKRWLCWVGVELAQVCPAPGAWAAQHGCALLLPHSLSLAGRQFF